MIVRIAWMLVVLCCVNLGHLKAQQPNVLFISVDDWNDWIGAMGNDQVKTPNVDRLAKRGVTFLNAHSPAVYCAPSRTAVMTGLAPHTTGCYYNGPFFAKDNHPDLIDLPGWFKANGYYVMGGGKLYHHMPGQIDFRSWDEYFIWNEKLKERGWGLDTWGEGAPLPNEIPYSSIAKYLDPNHDGKERSKKVNSYMEWGILKNEDEEKMADTICTNWAVAELQKVHDRPFFLGFGLYAPHKPNFVPKKYFDLYPLESIQLPEKNPAGPLASLPKATADKYLKRMKRLNDPMLKLNCVKEAIQGYLAAISYADAMIGRVMDALEKSHYRQNTIVVLWSDNGYHLGERGAWAKHTLWERTSNVPFIWAGPKISKGKVIQATVSLLDTFPTLNSLCGLPSKSNMDGVDLSGVLRVPELAKDRTVVQTDDGSYSVINRTWRYIKRANGEEELYHVKVDPNEWRNLADSPEMAKIKQELMTYIPQSAAKAVKSGKAKTLRPVFKGEHFYWVANKKNKSHQ